MSSGIDLNHYKVHPPLDLDISDFFKEVEASKWNFQSFSKYVLAKDPQVKSQKLKEMFETNCDRLLAFKYFPISIRSLIGSIKKPIGLPINSDPISSVTHNNYGIQFTNTNINNSTVNAVNNNGKKRKTHQVNEHGECNNTNNNDFWNLWKEYLNNCNCHKFCPEKYHTIECGYSIKCKPNYPEDLYNGLGDNTQQTVLSPFVKYPVYTQNVMQALKEDDERILSFAMFNTEHWEYINQGSRAAKFIYDFFYQMNYYFKNPPNLSANESMFNHQLVWPLMQLAIKTSNTAAKFYPGEIVLKASTEEYNADGIITLDNMEVCLLETSGQYSLEDKPRFGYDHVKGLFGAISMMRRIVKTWFFATESTFQELQVLFLHARGKSIHLWSLGMQSSGVHVMERLISTEIPIDANDFSKILEFGIFIWKLTHGLEQTCEVVNKMKQEHDDYLLAIQLGSTTKRENLATFVVNEIQKPERGTKYGILLPEELDLFKVETNFKKADD